MLIDITKLNKEEIVNLKPETVLRKITIEEFFHILETLNSLWLYSEGDLYHAKLKSGLCSDGFINLKEVLKTYPNIRKIIAYQLQLLIREKIKEGLLPFPYYVAGVPSAATELGNEVAVMLGAEIAHIVKDKNGKIRFLTKIPKGKSVLLIEDICSKATGISETIRNAHSHNFANIKAIIPFEFVILNRGGLSDFTVNGVKFEIIPVFEKRINEYVTLH